MFWAVEVTSVLFPSLFQFSINMHPKMAHESSLLEENFASAPCARSCTHPCLTEANDLMLLLVPIYRCCWFP